MRIETDRCLIRRFEEKDIVDFMAYRNNEKWMQYQGFKGLTKQEYSKVLLVEPDMQAGAQLAIIDKEAERLIGDIYLKQEENSFWLGYSINPASARQGFAFEAVSGIIGWLKDNGADKVLADAMPENVPSISLLKKLGFDFTGKDENGDMLFARDLK
ncbi:MAG: GNAT family N-acetyltransferase [Oscillospiraceae bacterium]